jgi:non-specific serine/threonine protein kinase
MRELQHGNGVADSLYSLGNVVCEQGDYSTARQMFEEGLAIRRERGDRRGMVASLAGLVVVVAARGEVLRAAWLWGAAEKGRADIGSQLSKNDQSRYDRRVAAARVALGDDAAFDHAWEEGRAMTLEHAIELALEKTTERG